MALLPADIPTGTVTGTFYFVHEDEVDANTDPEMPVVSGTVTFTCSAPVLRVPTQATTLVPLEFKAKFNSSGQLIPVSGTGIGIELPATNSTLFNPTNFTWRVTFDLVDVTNGHTVTNIEPFSISVPVGVTTDLTAAMPISTSPGTITVQGPQGNTGPAGPEGQPGDTSYRLWVPRSQPNYLKREEKLGSYQALLPTATTTPLNMITLGDSIAEGTGVSNAIYRWQNTLQRDLNYRHGCARGAEFPWIPVWPKTSAPGMPVTRAGNITADTVRGLWGKSGVIGDTGAVTFTFTGTSFKLAFLKGSTTGQMQVVLDGAAPVTVDTNSTTNPPGLNVAFYTSAALSNSLHTVTVTRAAASAYSVFLFGMLTYNGDETKGIRVLDGAYHGSASTFVTSARVDQLNYFISAVGNVGAVICNLGTNDYTANDVVGYKTNMTLLVTKLREVYSGTIVLMDVYKGLVGTTLRDEAQWAQFGNALREIAETDANVAYFDWRMRMPDVPAPYNDPAGLGLFADGLHPSDIGNAWIGSMLTDYLSDRAR